MCIAYNLTRLVYLELEHGVEVDFTCGAEKLKRERWVSLEELHTRFRGHAMRSPTLREVP